MSRVVIITPAAAPIRSLIAVVALWVALSPGASHAILDLTGNWDVHGLVSIDGSGPIEVNFRWVIIQTGDGSAARSPSPTR